MADQKSTQSPYPLMAPAANGHARSDEESYLADHSTELKKKKRMKCLLYIVLFAVFQIGVIALFALTVMKIRDPKFRVQSGSSDSTFNVGTEASPSFNMQMSIELGVKNTNFGHFKYDSGVVMFQYRGVTVGQAIIDNGRARARSTKKVSLTVNLISPSSLNSELGSDISTGFIPLTTHSKLDGKIHLMKVFKKKKSAEMNCTMQVDISQRTLENIVCD